jgi:hypothetical protein
LARVVFVRCNIRILSVCGTACQDGSGIPKIKIKELKMENMMQLQLDNSKKLLMAYNFSECMNDLVGAKSDILMKMKLSDLRAMHKEYMEKSKEIRKKTPQVNNLLSRHPSVQSYDDYMNSAMAIRKAIAVREIINSI